MFDEMHAQRVAFTAFSDSLRTRDEAQPSMSVKDMRLVAYNEVRGAWEAHFKNDSFPDYRIVVSHIGHTLYTDVYERITRFSAIEQDPLFSLNSTI